MKTLYDIPLNKPCTVQKLKCDGPLKRRLLDLGIIQNTKITPVLKSPSGDPTAFDRGLRRADTLDRRTSLTARLTIIEEAEQQLISTTEESQLHADNYQAISPMIGMEGVKPQDFMD